MIGVRSCEGLRFCNNLTCLHIWASSEKRFLGVKGHDEFQSFSIAAAPLKISRKERKVRIKRTVARIHPNNAAPSTQKIHLLQVQSESRVPLPMCRHSLSGDQEITFRAEHNVSRL
jgi:hypothetical protein